MMRDYCDCSESGEGEVIMKERMNKLIKRGRRIPRTTYVLMFFLGFYMGYLIYRMVEGLQEPGVHMRELIYAGIGIFGLIGLVFILIGGFSLIKKNYKEAWPEDDEN